jgi:hypothetical protein
MIMISVRKTKRDSGVSKTTLEMFHSYEVITQRFAKDTRSTAEGFFAKLSVCSLRVFAQ